MKNLTQSAKTRLDSYIREMKICLQSCKTVDSDEVERNIIDHIDNELSGLSEPVSFEQMDAVLKKLGSPKQWVPEEEMSWWSKIILRLRTGPEDWRLAYLSFGVLIIGTALGGPFGLLGSFCLSRSAIAISDKEEIQNKKWLIYPSLIIVYLLIFLPICLALLFWPIIIGCFCGEFLTHSHFCNLDFSISVILTAISVAILCLAIWWSIIWLIIRRRFYIMNSIFRPFAETWKLKWFSNAAITASIIGIIFTIVTAAFWLYPVL